MRVKEFYTFPAQYLNIKVYPEYYSKFDELTKAIKDYGSFGEGEENRGNNIIEVVGVGKSIPPYTSVVLIHNEKIIGIRHKISIFTGENTVASPKLEVFDIIDKKRNWRIGMVICREVLHTAIAEIYRMMQVNLITVSIGGGDFYGMQRESWIDQMCLFSDIVNCPLICSSEANEEEGGLNLIIERYK